MRTCKVENGRNLYPHMHGDEGWYAYTPEKFNAYALEAYFLSMKTEDRERVARTRLAGISGRAQSRIPGRIPAARLGASPQSCPGNAQR